jgi:predicted nuclease of predicted toxin-antitoxin system
MTIWIDAHLSPEIAAWLTSNYPVHAIAIRDIGLRDSSDEEIYDRARKDSAVIMTKDHDFVILLDRFGPPPQIILITSGNTSNNRLKEILSNSFPQALDFLKAGEKLVEIVGG